MPSRRIADGLTILVSFMWAVNLTVGLIYPGRSDPYVNAIFGSVVGAVLVIGRRATRSYFPPARSAVRRAAADREDEDEEDPDSPEEDGR